VSLASSPSKTSSGQMCVNHVISTTDFQRQHAKELKNSKEQCRLGIMKDLSYGYILSVLYQDVKINLDSQN